MQCLLTEGIFPENKIKNIKQEINKQQKIKTET